MSDHSLIFNLNNVSDIKKRIKHCFSSEKRVYMESALLKLIDPALDIVNMNQLDLYRVHFVLFHALYLLQKEYQEQNQYLHVYFSHIALYDYPSKGRCRYFDEVTKLFCKSSIEPNDSLCCFHREKMKENQIDHLSSRYFYLDLGNYTNMNEDKINSFLNGTWEMLLNHQEIQESYRILDCPPTQNLSLIKKQFKIMAKKYHPDINSNDHQEFLKINRAYHLLLSVISKM